MVLGNSNGDRSVASLTDGEFDFYKTLYGCAENATRGECAKFTRLSLTRGLKLLAGFDLGEKMTGRQARSASRRAATRSWRARSRCSAASSR